MADPKIKYDIEAAVSGEAAVNDLAQRLEDMGKVLDGDLGPAAKAAAAEMRTLGQQQSAIVAFGKLSEQVKVSQRELTLAKGAAKSFAEDISAAGPPTAQQAATLARLNDQVQISDAKLAGQKESLQAANQELLKYGLTGDRLIEAQRQTSASFDKLKASVQATLPAFKSVGTEGATSARQIQDAWSTLGTKSFAQTQAEIAKVKAALETVKATSKSPIEIKIATDAAHAQIAQLEGGVKSVGVAAGGLTGLLRQLGPLMAATFGAHQFIDTITQAESLNRSYGQIFGSVAKAREEMEFIKTTSNRLGVETLTLAKSYQSLAASTKGTALEGQATRDVFEAVSRAMSMLGKSSAETDHALLAISQMASKGTVAMQELRQQLGDAMPGAMKAAADGAGLTVEQLTAMVETGSVLAQDLLPALTVGLNNLYANAAPPQTVTSEWARFKNEIDATAIAIGEGGGNAGLAAALAYAAGVFGRFHTVTQDAGSELAGYAFAVTDAGNKVVDFTKNLLGLDQVKKDMAGGTGKAAAAERDLAAAQVESGNAAQEAFRRQELLNQSHEVGAESVLKVRQRYQDLAKGSAAYVAQVTKEVDARAAESTVLTQLVNVYGTEIEKRQVAVSVAQTQAAITEKLAAARNTEAMIAASYVVKLQEQAKATGDVTEATKKQIEEAQKSAAAKQTEFERTNALAEAKRIEAAASAAQAQALKDNSSRVGEYASAVDAAAREVERLNAAHQQGKATDAQVIEGKAKLAAATLLYRDALADATKKAELAIVAQQRAGQLAQAGIGVDIERVKAMQEVAAAQGNNAAATQLATQLTNLQTQASQAQADAARNEAEKIRALADQKEKELKATGQLTDAAREDIAARRQAADLKDLEAQKSDILTSKILALAQANDTETASLNANNDARERSISVQEKANELAERAAALERKRKGIDENGFATDKNGKTIVMGGELTTLTGIAAFLKNAGVSDDATAKRIALQFSDGRGNIPYNNPGQGKYGGKSISEALLKAAELYTFGPGLNGGAAAPATIPQPDSTRTVNVDLRTNNGTVTVPTTEAGAQALLSVLQSAAQRAA